ncbi:MAG: hypothetical protein HRT66_03390 [Flavobacteriaceae bacterium]|nr:hypothetical protein [Flavobacteriaceae bacterium]
MMKTISKLSLILILVLFSCAKDETTQVDPITEDPITEEPVDTTKNELLKFELKFTNDQLAFEYHPDIEISQEDNNIVIYVPFIASLEDILTEIEISPGATISPESGLETTFLNGATTIYTVTSQDGTSTQYSITIEKQYVGTKLERLERVFLDSQNKKMTYREFAYNEQGYMISETQHSLLINGVDITYDYIKTYEYDQEGKLTNRYLTTNPTGEDTDLITISKYT